MKFETGQAVQLLSATPGTLRALLGNLGDEWTHSDGNTEQWEAFDIVGHLIHGEETDWIPRAKIILEQGDNRKFEPFDRLAQFERSKGKSLAQLLDEFEAARRNSLAILASWNLRSDDLELIGEHPEFGNVTLGQLIATWVVHDLTHIRQIVTVMAKRYDSEVGPWKAYTSILK
jgi:hypothetical protein